MSVLAGIGYPIARATGRCAATGREFSIGEHYVATLVERDGQEELARADYCLDAWESGARPALPARLFASWRAVVPDSGSKKQAFLGDDELLELFERLAETTEARRLAFRYLLALMLVRRKVLKYEGTREGIMTVRQRVPAGAPQPEAWQVVDPKLDDQTIAGAMEQLGEIMALDGPGTLPAKAAE